MESERAHPYHTAMVAMLLHRERLVPSVRQKPASAECCVRCMQCNEI